VRLVIDPESLTQRRIQHIAYLTYGDNKSTNSCDKIVGSGSSVRDLFGYDKMRARTAACERWRTTNGKQRASSASGSNVGSSAVVAGIVSTSSATKVAALSRVLMSDRGNQGQGQGQGRNRPLTVPLPRIAGSAGMVCHCAATVSSVFRVNSSGSSRQGRTEEHLGRGHWRQKRKRWRFNVVWYLSAVCVGRGIKAKKLTSTP